MDNLKKSKFKFIHAADIHLGSIIHATCGEIREIDTIFKYGVYKAFNNICEFAIKTKVDFILLCGDVYDRESRTVRAAEIFHNECKRLNENNINVYIIRGNHDPIGKSEELFNLPDNVYIFDNEKTENFEMNKDDNFIARIVGQSYKGKWEGRKVFQNYIVEDNSSYNIALLHTQLEPQNNNYLPCSSKELIKNKNINYWALGHIHKCRIINEKSPVIVYPGIPQGRDIGEKGIGGCLLVEVMEDYSTNLSFVPTSSVIWEKIIVDINDYNNLENLNDLEEVLVEKSELVLNSQVEVPENLESTYPPSQLLKGYVVQWDIQGRGKINEVLREDKENIIDYLRQTLNERFVQKEKFLYTDSIEINTKKAFKDLEKFKENTSICNEINSIIESISQDEELKKEFIKSFGNVFEKKYDIEDINQEKIQLDEEIIEEIINEAREIVLEKLIEKGEQF
ncbi:DNA repair exonuclease [Clostridium sp. MB40-C1]|uniref:metallophosphoesterase family protein n=1 Tax=Clostridium sp. MB40-C1 TaxID=3070996 RepID=UPI0027DFBD19|nr:DNA repair exonuclease [Clostridium sp. MB40-C1]WMJ80865.1 DNA repair exonuclease [Clostridium sp. MB40-C1]